uniref:Reverse transcriptase domain-containing protein n=1 Tax=Fagus sylvatica TaxID=28930 RepID=A0A2N9G7V8_FAGSY
MLRRRFFGDVIEVDLAGSGDGAGKRFVRIRARLLVNQPLPIDCHDEEVQIMWKDKVIDGIYGSWLREKSSEFQPGTDLEKLKNSDKVECNSVPKQGSSEGESSSRTKSKWDSVLAVWNELMQRENMDQSENTTNEAEEDEVMEKTVELVRVRNRGTTKPPVHQIQSLQVNGSQTKDEGISSCTNSAIGPLGLSGLDQPDFGSPFNPNGRGGGPYHAPTSSMRLMSWNCRGIGRAPTARTLKTLVRGECPDVLFLAKTKVKSPRIENLKAGMGFSNCFSVDSINKAGGLAIFWKQGVEMEVVFSNHNVIAALISSDPLDHVWLLLAVVAKDSEKKGGSSKGSYSSRSFQRWQNLFQKAGVRHLMAHNSDHNPIALDTHLDLSQGSKPFRFEAMWVRDDSSKEVVRQAWDVQISDPDEIKVVVWEMNSHKAPSPDGFPGLFFKKYWDTVGSQVIAAVQSFFRDGCLLKQLNHTFITLIPKRLDPSQTAFVPKRWIAENMVLAQEVVHSFNQMKRKKGYVGFKLNFKKAHDSLEWEFILSMLRAMGFDQKVIMLIHQCISIVHYTHLLNGTKSSSIEPSRRLRQGDPLSPFLFIMCADVLARMINREVLRGAIKGVKVNPGADAISKLFYADDVILFYDAKTSEVEALMQCIEKYCLWSGQTISVEKSGIFVSKGVHRNFIAQVESLIKSVAQASPVYAMSSCKLPRKLCSEMDSVVLSGRDSFCVKVLKAKYHVSYNWLDSSLFDQETILAIQNIPRWSSNQRDRWIWMKSSSREFSVKSAYKEVCSIDPDSEGSAIMKRLWKTQLHQRLKMLQWRIDVGVLPTHDSLCGIYTDHFQLDSGVDLVEAIVFPSNKLADSFTLKRALLIDLLWNAKNHKVHEDGAVKAKSLMLDFDKKWRDHSTVFFKSVPLVKSSLESFRWERPKVVVIKINCDAAVGRHFSSIATVARDWRGNMVFALSRKVNTIIPLQAEAEAILWAGQLAVLYGFPTVVIESDCKECVQTGNRVDLCPWQIQSLVLEFLDAMDSLHC